MTTTTTDTDHDDIFDRPVLSKNETIAALADIVDGLYPWSSLLGEKVYQAAHEKARSSLLWRLAWAGALDGAVVYDECGRPYGTIVKLDHGIDADPASRYPEPWLEITEPHGSCELASFVDNWCLGYVGLPETATGFDDAIVELARDWLQRTEPPAVAA